MVRPTSTSRRNRGIAEEKERAIEEAQVLMGMGETLVLQVTPHRSLLSLKGIGEEISESEAKKDLDTQGR